MSKIIVDLGYLACGGRVKVKVNAGKVMGNEGQGHIKVILVPMGKWLL